MSDPHMSDQDRIAALLRDSAEAWQRGEETGVAKGDAFAHHAQYLLARGVRVVSPTDPRFQEIRRRVRSRYADEFGPGFRADADCIRDLEMLLTYIDLGERSPTDPDLRAALDAGMRLAMVDHYVKPGSLICGCGRSAEHCEFRAWVVRARAALQDSRPPEEATQ